MQRLWLKIGREGEARFLSHLETMNVWIRALRRARLPLASGGASTPTRGWRFVDGAAGGRGVRGDSLDVLLAQTVCVESVADVVRNVLPLGLRVY